MVHKADTSLLALKTVINKLTDKKRYVRFPRKVYQTAALTTVVMSLIVIPN